MELPQVDLARIPGQNVLVSEEWFFRPKAVIVARSRGVQQNRKLRRLKILNKTATHKRSLGTGQFEKHIDNRRWKNDNECNKLRLL